jgi:hypothetical protein
MDSDRFARYLAGERWTGGGEVDTRWVELDRRLYFAGVSTTWGGPVAFISLTTATGFRIPALARLLTLEELEAVAQKENGASGDIPLLPSRLPEDGEWLALPVTFDGAKGKYNAIAGLPAIDGRPAFTFTTGRELELGVPTVEYQRLMESASGRAVRVASQPAAGTNRAFLTRDVFCRGTFSSGASVGFKMVSASQALSPEKEALLMGTARFGGEQRDVWVLFKDPQPSLQMTVDAGLVESLTATSAISGGTGSRECELDLSFSRPVRFRRQPGRIGDIPESDVVYLSHHDATGFDGWALLVEGRMTGPVQVRGRDHVRDGEARVAYALRVLASTSKDESGSFPEHVTLQAIPHVSRATAGWIGRWALAAGKWVIGAPPVALRSTEGLVGDDGMNVVRVDVTALDFLGCSSGDTVVVGWGPHSTRARVLLHTDVTRERMRAQLSESTGVQARLTTGDLSARLETPQHLQAWVSSSVRDRLNIPPDSIVRIRRSIRHTLAKNAALLALPVAGVVFAAWAIPAISWWALLAVPPILAFSFLPVRMRRL